MDITTISVSPAATLGIAAPPGFGRSLLVTSAAIPRRSSSSIKYLPLPVSGWYAIDFASRSVRLNASTESTVGTGSPARTATPKTNVGQIRTGVCKDLALSDHVINRGRFEDDEIKGLASLDLAHSGRNKLKSNR